MPIFYGGSSAATGELRSKPRSAVLSDSPPRAVLERNGSFGETPYGIEVSRFDTYSAGTVIALPATFAARGEVFTTPRLFIQTEEDLYEVTGAAPDSGTLPVDPDPSPPPPSEGGPEEPPTPPDASDPGAPEEPPFPPAGPEDPAPAEPEPSEPPSDPGEPPPPPPADEPPPEEPPPGEEPPPMAPPGDPGGLAPV